MLVSGVKLKIPAVASGFEANHRKYMFGKVENFVYCLWAPINFALKTQVN
jgi:hypothetical protein